VVRRPCTWVDRVNYHYKLEYGKYRRDASRLYVEEATRYLLNKHLNSLLAQDPAESLGERMQEGGERRVGDVDGGGSGGGNGGGEEGEHSGEGKGSERESDGFGSDGGDGDDGTTRA